MSKNPGRTTLLLLIGLIQVCTLGPMVSNPLYCQTTEKAVPETVQNPGLPSIPDTAEPPKDVPKDGTQTTRRPNVMVITIDCLRSDYLAVYGYEQELAPEITKLAESGVVFENCTTQAPWTIPSMASMNTGLYPTTHNAFDNIHQLGKDYKTMAEVFSDNGYTTGAFLAHSVLVLAGNGQIQGFSNVNGGMAVREKITFKRLLPPLFEFMTDHRGNPMYLWLHLMEVHYPLTRGNPYATRGTRYEAEIRYVSSLLSTIFDQMKTLGIYDNTIIVFTADHGEHLGKYHPEVSIGHQQSVYQDLLQVPLIISGPGFPKDARESAMVELIDILPTVAEAAGIDPGTVIQGKSMMPLVRNEVESIRDYSFSERYYLRYPAGSTQTIHHLAVICYPWKLYAKILLPQKPDGQPQTLGKEPLKWTIDQEGSTFQLFNLKEDPHESKDVAGLPENATMLAELKGELVKFRDHQTALAALGGSILDNPSQESLSQLRDLGYITD